MGAVGLADVSDGGRLIGDGPDLIPLLQRLSTAQLAGLAPGELRETVLTTPKGRIFERVYLARLDEERSLLCVGPGRGPAVLSHLERYTFAEKTGLADRTARTFQLALYGPRVPAVLAELGIADAPRSGVRALAVDGCTTHLLRPDARFGSGASLTGAADDRETVRARLREAVEAHGGREVARDALESWRIALGLPASPAELNEDYNPLEAGLWEAVSFDKGCYVGQEVVARLRTYDKVSRKIVAVEARPPLPEPGATLSSAGRAFGTLTSLRREPGSDRALGLAYVKLRSYTQGMLAEAEPERSPVTLRDLPGDGTGENR